MRRMPTAMGRTTSLRPSLLGVKAVGTNMEGSVLKTRTITNAESGHDIISYHYLITNAVDIDAIHGDRIGYRITGSEAVAGVHT